MKLSPHFTLAEMVASQTASRHGLYNNPSPSEIERLTALCENVLEPVREHFKAPVIVSSGYRGPEVNRKVGGSRSSQHCSGEAADFTVVGVTNLDVCEWIRDNLDFDQLIYEFGESGWIHASYGPRMRHQCLSAIRKGKRTVYTSGF